MKKQNEQSSEQRTRTHMHSITCETFIAWCVAYVAYGLVELMQLLSKYRFVPRFLFFKFCSCFCFGVFLLGLFRQHMKCPLSPWEGLGQRTHAFGILGWLCPCSSRSHGNGHTCQLDTQNENIFNKNPSDSCRAKVRMSSTRSTHSQS